MKQFAVQSDRSDVVRMFDTMIREAAAADVAKKSKEKVGAAVQESLQDIAMPHFARKSVAGEERFKRTRFALLRVNRSILCSAIATIGSAAILLFCTCNVFRKIGAIFITLTVLSILCCF